jgi:hypothetical protein
VYKHMGHVPLRRPFVCVKKNSEKNNVSYSNKQCTDDVS